MVESQYTERAEFRDFFNDSAELIFNGRIVDERVVLKVAAFVEFVGERNVVVVLKNA